MREKRLLKRIEFHEEAKGEMAESASWYEERKAGLGEEFLTEVENKLEKIADKPDSYSIVYQDVRETSLSRFPFLIYYIIKTPIIYILSVWHKRRDRAGWKERV